MVSAASFSFIRSRSVYLQGRRKFHPESFTRKYAVTPTPGGRWKVRQLRKSAREGGGYLAYSEAGPSRSYNRRFHTFWGACNYAHAQAYICRAHTKRNSTPQRRRVQKRLYQLPSHLVSKLTPEVIDIWIQVEKEWAEDLL